LHEQCKYIRKTGGIFGKAMEDPITFDVWGRVDPEHRAEAATILGQMQPALGRKAILQAIVNSIGRGRDILVAERLGWTFAQSSTRDLAGVFTDLRVFQAGYGPELLGCLQTCAVHSLHRGGIRCPVCSGFYDDRPPPTGGPPYR
jgi:hypothetical protein